jgi:hypothetical protein
MPQYISKAQNGRFQINTEEKTVSLATIEVLFSKEGDLGDS